MQILIIRKNLETGTETEFDILENYEFKRSYSHRPLNLFPQFVEELLNKWNAQQPKTWHYRVK